MTHKWRDAVEYRCKCHSTAGARRIFDAGDRRPVVLLGTKQYLIVVAIYQLVDSMHRKCFGDFSRMVVLLA